MAEVCPRRTRLTSRTNLPSARLESHLQVTLSVAGGTKPIPSEAAAPPTEKRNFALLPTPNSKLETQNSRRYG